MAGQRLEIRILVRAIVTCETLHQEKVFFSGVLALLLYPAITSVLGECCTCSSTVASISIVIEVRSCYRNKFSVQTYSKISLPYSDFLTIP